MYVSLIGFKLNTQVNSLVVLRKQLTAWTD